jgi:hypothetical protein
VLRSRKQNKTGVVVRVALLFPWSAVPSASLRSRIGRIWARGCCYVGLFCVL